MSNYIIPKKQSDIKLPDLTMPKQIVTAYEGNNYVMPKQQQHNKNNPYSTIPVNADLALGLASNILNPYEWSVQTKSTISPDGYINTNNQFDIDGSFTKSLFDTPLIGQLIFNPNGDQIYYNYNTLSNSNSKSIPIPQFRIENCILTINQNKRLVKTNINGRDGAVIEYSGLDNYNIKINGTILSNKNGVSPDYTDLIKICEAPVSLKISHNILNYTFGINYIFIDEYVITQKEGGISQQEVEISAQSDNPIDYKALFNL